MLLDERQIRIRDILARQPRCTVEQLCRKLKVSRSTVRRDLIRLEKLGELVRVHGGVLHRDYLHGELSFDRRREMAIDAKLAIAHAAADLIPPNSSVYLDAGTSCLELARLLFLRDDLKIFTHSIRVLTEARNARPEVICIGGQYREVTQALVGGLTLHWLEHLHVDVGVLGASGVCPKTGLSTTELSEAGVKQKVIDIAQRCVVLADSSKWNKPAAVNFAAWSAINDFVCDAGLGRADAAWLRGEGVNVITA